MSDRELLELAAKAAGLEFSDGRQLSPAKYLARPVGSTSNDEWTGWNPLTDDGDALRLAVKLCISIDPRGDAVCAIAKDGNTFIEMAIKNGDLIAATRVAIVHAAAGGSKNSSNFKPGN